RNRMTSKGSRLRLRRLIPDGFTATFILGLDSAKPRILAKAGSKPKHAYRYPYEITIFSVQLRGHWLQHIATPCILMVTKCVTAVSCGTSTSDRKTRTFALLSPSKIAIGQALAPPLALKLCPLRFLLMIRM